MARDTLNADSPGGAAEGCERVAQGVEVEFPHFRPLAQWQPDVTPEVARIHRLAVAIGKDKLLTQAIVAGRVFS
jgi:hypothetical protein